MENKTHRQPFVLFPFKGFTGFNGAYQHRDGWSIVTLAAVTIE
jgi:hypothetical protein